MKRRAIIALLSIVLSCSIATAQEAQKSELQQRAETEIAKGNAISGRSLYIRAYEDYVNKGRLQQGVECGTKATQLYYKDNLYQEAFDLLRLVDQAIATKEPSKEESAAMRYQTTKERMQMYILLRKGENAKVQIENMERYAATSGQERLRNDVLYNKAIYYYTFGQNTKGNEVFQEMAKQLTASKEYDKVDQVYKALIANGRRSNSASMVAQSYNSYMQWKDSVNALKVADEINALKKQIADNEQAIAEKDGSLSARTMIITALCVLAALLAAALIVGAIVLLRYIMLTRKQKRAINMANENNALKAKFIKNISAQLEPTLQKLDNRQQEVKALLDFSQHIQTLSQLENDQQTLELEDTPIQQFCENIMEQIRGKVRDDVTLTVNAPKMTAAIYREYVTHILTHLLNNAAEYTPEGGHIWLDYKKRGAHTHQFLVSDTGSGIPEEKREDVFKAFTEVKDLTHGDGLGLPICRQMALNMNGDLEIDSQFTKGTRFVLELHA